MKCTSVMKEIYFSACTQFEWVNSKFFSYFSISAISLCFSLPVLPLPSPQVLHLTFQLEKEWKWNMTMRHFFYSCWPNRSRLLNTGWEERIKRRSSRAAGCEAMEVTHSSLLCGTKQRCSITNSLRIPPFFIISNSTLSLIMATPLKSPLPVQFPL